ncbi:MAG: asparagine synthase-related protein, partial [Gammaproteobacteria bacterium]
TFSIGFDSAGFDEAPYARAVAGHLGTEHTELYVAPGEARAVIPELPAIYDEPFADSSQIPTLLVAQLARQSVTVAMSGDGGDELFVGYTRYSMAHDLWARAQRNPYLLRALCARALRALSPAAWDRVFACLGPLLPPRLRQPNAGDKLHKLARLLTLHAPHETYLSLVSLWQEPARLLRDCNEPASILAPLGELPEGLSFVEQMMALDTLHYLPGDILVKLDRASMATSLEARVPFLDTALMGLAWSLPQGLKVRHGDGKWVLREVLARHVPRALFERPKMGFGVPIGEWLRGPLREWAEHLLDAGRLRDGGIFEPGPIRDAWAAHLAGGENLQYLLWGILMFEAWRERWPLGEGD